MSNKFPTINKTINSGESGVNLVSSIVNDNLGWIFRKNHAEHDYGIDGYIDIVTDNGAVTGQSIAVQIKSGISFFKQKTSNGYTFYGEMKHLNYYRNFQTPILIIICDLNAKKCYYAVFDEFCIEPTTKNWKINIQQESVFSEKSKEKILKLLPHLKDDTTEIELHWSQNKEFEDSSLIFYSIDREDIETMNIYNLLNFTKRLCINDNLCRKIQGKLEVMIDGYNYDRRELFEIKAVRRWIKKIEKKKIPWFYYCNTGEYSYWLTTYLHCVVGTTIQDKSDRYSAIEAVHYYKNENTLPKLQINFDKEAYGKIVSINWLRLNEITDRLGISNEVNKLISYEVSKTIYPHMPEEIDNIFKS